MCSQQQNRRKEVFTCSSCNFEGHFVSCHVSRAPSPQQPLYDTFLQCPVASGHRFSCRMEEDWRDHVLKGSSVPTLRAMEPRSCRHIPSFISVSSKITQLGISSRYFPCLICILEDVSLSLVMLPWPDTTPKGAAAMAPILFLSIS